MLLSQYNPDEYAISTRLLDSSFGPAYPQTPRLFVIHSTGILGTGVQTDTVEREYRYFNDPSNQVSATYCIDSTTIAQFVPLDQIAWHVGSIGNRIAWGVELCESTNRATALEVIRRGIWLATKMVLDHGMLVVSHNDISQLWPAAQFSGSTDHTDPNGFFQYHGYSWAEFKANVDALVRQARENPGQPQPVQVGKTTIPHGIFLGGQTLVPVRAYTDALWQLWQSRQTAPRVVWNGPGQPVQVD